MARMQSPEAGSKLFAPGALSLLLETLSLGIRWLENILPTRTGPKDVKTSSSAGIGRMSSRVSPQNNVSSAMSLEVRVCIKEPMEDLTQAVPAVQTSSLRSSAEIKLVARHPEVYEPCDDSFALVDALLADRANILGQKPRLCVEVGCGSGYVITSLALIIGSGGATQYIATDISPIAAEVSSNTLAAHGVQADVVVTDLVSGLEKRLAGDVDVLLFNPPYVPTPDEELGVGGLTASWAGGEKGRVVIDRMLGIVDSLLSCKGFLYMVTLSENNPGEICRIMSKKGFASRIIIQRNTEEEKLYVLKFWRDEFHPGWSEFGSSPPTGDASSFTSRMARLAFWRVHSPNNDTTGGKEGLKGYG